MRIKRRSLKHRSGSQLRNISVSRNGLSLSVLKVLSLFFIDRVDNYALETGVIRRLFKKSFNELNKDTSVGET